MRILVVDDEPMVRFLLVRFLEEEGHTVDEAADGIDALEHLKPAPIRLANHRCAYAPHERD
jgi:CheY-like chemotaxis protein